MTQLEHLQQVILSIAKDIDVLCKKNGIQYYLLGGSAIGAVRHQGFIPWDDDLDIIMDNENYNKFIDVCKNQLNKDKYYFQEGLKDWPLYFSKIKLKGTHLVEIEGKNDSETDGIYVDVFKMDNVSANKFIAHWQYFCGKLFLSYMLAQRSYDSATLKKRLLMFLSFPLKVKFIRNFIQNQVEQFNGKKTPYLGFFYGRTKFRSAVIKRSIYGTPKYVKFEDTQLPIAERSHEYLTQVFGNYMKLPPKEQQVGLHLINVDFGKY